MMRQLGKLSSMKKIANNSKRNDIKDKAARLTAEAIAQAKGAQPTMTEARHLEIAAGSTHAPDSSEFRVTEDNPDEAAAAHNDMMNSILSSMNGEGDNA